VGILSNVRALLGPDQLSEERDATYPLSLSGYANLYDGLGGFNYSGWMYPLSGLQQSIQGKAENINPNFAGLARGAMGINGVVFACMQARMALLSEARFQFQGMKAGRPGDLYGTPELKVLENPWPTATTGDLITRADQDVSLSGNFFGVRLGDRIKRLRPDWVTMVLTGENGDPETEVLGIMFKPGGPGSDQEPKYYTVDQIVHYAPYPDPLASYRGMSWLTPIIREIQADTQATMHKEASFINGATPNMIVKLDVNNVEKFEAMKRAFRDNHEGSWNANKTLFLAGGADATVVGQNFQQLDFKALQGSAETRIAAASGVHPVVVALSEGLQGSSLNAGNFQAAARLTADKFLRPWWRGFAGSIGNVINVPGGSRLWYDDRDVAFLRSDVKDAAEIAQMKAQTIRQYLEAGFEAESVIKAVNADDTTLLIHTGLFSVQLQAPGSTKMPQGEAPGELPVGGGTGPEKPAINPAAAPSNGNGKPPSPAPVMKAIDPAELAELIRARQPDTIHIHPSEVHVDAAPTPSVEVHTPDVHVEPRIEVTTPDVHVDVQAAEAPNVEVHPPEVHVAAPEVTVEPRFDVPVPDVSVNVEAPEPADVTVNVEPPDVTVQVPEPKPTTRKVVRDRKGRIARIEED